MIYLSLFFVATFPTEHIPPLVDARVWMKTLLATPKPGSLVLRRSGEPIMSGCDNLAIYYAVAMSLTGYPRGKRAESQLIRVKMALKLWYVGQQICTVVLILTFTIARLGHRCY